jgi:transcriptional regulator with XRE-family HTH domain
MPMNIKKTFGTNLRKLRTEKGFSQEKFAELCGLHRTYISDIECFQRNVSLENIQKIAEALQIPAYFLLMEEEHHESEIS